MRIANVLTPFFRQAPSTSVNEIGGRHPEKLGRTRDPRRWESLARMDSAAAIVLVLLVVLPAALVGGLFVWAALKDGQEDKALQARLGIRRRTRLGR
jgi:hypothetical protein